MAELKANRFYIAKNCYIHNHVSITGNTTIGENTEIFPFASIGSSPQDLKFKGESTTIKIGKNCIITGQVGFAGSSKIGNNVMIGGQAGISGHLKIGNNVKIAGGSGVIKNIPDNTKVMGYPAKDIKKFIMENK